MKFWSKKNIFIIICLIAILIFLATMGNSPAVEFQNSDLKYSKPSTHHIFGNDSLGRDLFIRIVYATKNAISIALYSILTCVFIATIYGAYAGYASGIAEKIMVMIMNIIGSIPDFLIAIFLMMFFNNIGLKNNNGSLFGIFGTLVIVSWIPVARVIKNETKKIMNNDYILYSKLKGAKFFHIFFHHIIPNIKNTIIILVIQRVPSAIFLEAFLSFIGIGLQPPIPSLGKMISEGIKTARLYPHLLIIPSICLILIILIFNIIGEVLIKKLNDEELKNE